LLARQLQRQWLAKFKEAVENETRLSMKTYFLDAWRCLTVGQVDSVRFHSRIDSSARGNSRRFFFGRRLADGPDQETGPAKRDNATKP
jgi:hypothetical protein